MLVEFSIGNQKNVINDLNIFNEIVNLRRNKIDNPLQRVEINIYVYEGTNKKVLLKND